MSDYITAPPAGPVAETMANCEHSNSDLRNWAYSETTVARNHFTSVAGMAEEDFISAASTNKRVIFDDPDSMFPQLHSPIKDSIIFVISGN